MTDLQQAFWLLFFVVEFVFCLGFRIAWAKRFPWQARIVGGIIYSALTTMATGIVLTFAYWGFYSSSFIIHNFMRLP